MVTSGTLQKAYIFRRPEELAFLEASLLETAVEFG